MIQLAPRELAFCVLILRCRRYYSDRSKSARERISIGSIISDHFSVKHLSVIQRLL